MYFFGRALTMVKAAASYVVFERDLKRMNCHQ